MHVSTTQVLRKFAQKMAAQNKQANPMAGIGAALSDPKTLGTIAGAAGTGLGAYGLARAMQSDEDREQGSWLPALAGIAGAAGGGYAGSQLGPQLAAMLQGGGKGVAPAAATNSDSLPEIMNGPGGDVDVSQPTRAGITAPKPAPVDEAARIKSRAALDWTPNAETQDYMAENGIQSHPLSGATGPNVAAYHAMGEEPGVVTGEGGKQVPTPGMAGKPMMGLGSR